VGGPPDRSDRGDSFGELVHAEQLGVRVAEQNVAGVTEALRRTLYDKQFAASAAANVARVRERFTWEPALAPLVAFCANPTRAADAATDIRRFARRPLLPASRAGVTQPERAGCGSRAEPPWSCPGRPRGAPARSGVGRTVLTGATAPRCRANAAQSHVRETTAVRFVSSDTEGSRQAGGGRS
jgi:hypothetical protein